MQTLDQLRAKYAWERVQDSTKEYGGLAKSMPALIMSNGLLQTLAFLKGKGKAEHDRLLADILFWLADKSCNVLSANGKNFKMGMAELAQSDSMKYQRATEEALAILRWIRHLASAVLAAEKKP